MKVPQVFMDPQTEGDHQQDSKLAADLLTRVGDLKAAEHVPAIHILGEAVARLQKKNISNNMIIWQGVH